MEYIIKNKKMNNYYNKTITDSSYHFVLDINEAYIFKNKWDANRQFKKFISKENYEIIKMLTKYKKSDKMNMKVRRYRCGDKKTKKA